MKKYVLLSSFLSLFTSTALATTIKYEEYEVGDGKRSVRMLLSETLFKPSTYKGESTDPLEGLDLDFHEMMSAVIPEHDLIKTNNESKIKRKDLKGVAPFFSSDSYQIPLNDPLYKYFTHIRQHCLDLPSKLRLTLATIDYAHKNGTNFERVEDFTEYAKSIITNMLLDSEKLFVYLTRLIEQGISDFSTFEQTPAGFYNKKVNPFSEDKKENFAFYMKENGIIQANVAKDEILKSFSELTSRAVRQALDVLKKEGKTTELEIATARVRF